MVIPSLVLSLLIGGSCSLHPLHTTFTEMVEDPTSHVVMVTVRAFSDDLARALGAPIPASGTAPSLPDSVLARYVAAHLLLTDQAGHALPLRYTGQRQTADLSWIAFALPAATTLTGVSVANRLQAELYPDQVNLVQASYAGRRETLLFSGGDGPRKLP